MTCTLTSNIWTLAYKKTKTETGYEIDLFGGTLENGVFTFPHGTDQRTSKVVVETENLIKPVYVLNDDKLNIAIVESAGPKITNHLITFQDYTTEPLEVKYTYTTENGYFIMTFEPKITEDNLPEGNKTIVRFTLDNGYVFYANYNKYKADEKHYVLYWYDQNAKFADGILKYYHGFTNVSVKSVEFSLQLTTINPKYELRDENLTEAITESIWPKISPKIPPTVKDNLIQYKTVEIPIDVSYSFTCTPDGHFEMRFDPPITEDNLPEGHFIQMLEFTLTNGNYYVIYYTKLENDDGTFTVSWYDTNGSFADGIFRYHHTLNDVYAESAVVNVQFIKRQSRFELRDNQVAEAIDESLALRLQDKQVIEIPYTSQYSIDYTMRYGTSHVEITLTRTITKTNLKEGKNIKLFNIVLSAKINGYTTIISINIYYDKIWDGDVYTVFWHCSSDNLGSCEMRFTGNTILLDHTYTGFSVSESAFYRENLVVIYENPIVRDSLWKTMMINLVYPIGSVYTSFHSTSPQELFGVGTWEQITDRFLYCSDSSGETGGSKKITVANLPSHNHTFTGTKATGTFGTMHGIVGESWYSGPFSRSNSSNAGYDSGSDNDHYKITWTYTPTGSISSTGSGSDYMPPYITVYAWRRTA